MIIEKAATTGEVGPDEQQLETFFGCTTPKAVTVDGKTIQSKYNPVSIPSRFNPAKQTEA